MINFLIIEHEKQSAQNLFKLLTISGYNIDGIVSSAERAIMHIKISRPDIVLLNKNLNSELEAVKLAAFLKRKFNIPALLLAHESDKESVQDIQSDYILGILHKPYQLEKLQSEIKKVLSKLSYPKSTAINPKDCSKFQSILDTCSNHLTKIRTNLETFEKHLVPEIASYELLQQTKNIASEITNLLRECNKISRPETHLNTVKVNQLILSLLKELNNDFGELIILKLHLQDKLNTARVSPTGMRQALLNIFMHSRQLLYHGGELTVATKNIMANEAASFMTASNNGSPNSAKLKHFVEITISASGKELSQYKKSSIYNPFLYIKDSKQNGLSLKTAYSIIKQCKGYIKASHSSKRHSLKIYLPASADNMGAANISGNRNETVLVVEDENAVRTVTQRILTSLGYQTIVNSNGKTALQTIREMNGSIDLIILDMKLPEMDGSEFYNELQAINPKVPVLFVSGYDIKTESIKLRHSGIHASKFLQKPYDKDALRQKLDEILHHSELTEARITKTNL